MSTPAAKRRRVDAANITLRKPFHSPLIRRPNDGGPSQTTEQLIPAAAENENYSSSPSASAIRPSRSLGPLQQTPHRPSSPLKFRTPIKRGGLKAKIPATAIGIEDDADQPGGALLALVKAHRHTAQDAVIKDLDKKLEMVRQARRIEVASEAERPGEAVDQELRDLVAKWKGASRMAAEELFEIVRERVANSGGPKAWKEMRQRQLDFYQSWDQEEATKKRPVDGDGNRVLQEELEGDDEGGAAEEEARNEKELADGDEEEQSEPEFNMAQMLQSLNIDLSLLGYDGAEEKWVD
ncbi:hypothetical protein N0V93_001784 [Gnomoniopsis smithogilvyi]|uniref:Uncharacterized protein n=1 Tax=Gnomoniopsis smithogilvyi TaxID=1191159 RepID=A0A9W8Z4L8_9PEZI|nr:hypothetical protein N0V93_001784 [Gnomoniopsis smithogilvyi]